MLMAGRYCGLVCQPGKLSLYRRVFYPASGYYLHPCIWPPQRVGISIAVKLCLYLARAFGKPNRLPWGNSVMNWLLIP